MTHLQKDQVDVWCLSLELEEASLDSLQRLLSEDELMKAGRFLVERAKKHFIAARGFLRRLIGHYLKEKPERLLFQYGPQGKPSPAGKFEATGISFNVSHSHGMALYAVAWNKAVGVDIEKIDSNTSCIDIAERFFSPYEIEVLRNLTGDRQRRGFFNCWTRKEAYLKARGEGISSSLSRFDVSLVPGEPAVLLAHRTDPGEIFRWSFEDLDVHPDYAAAVVMEGRGTEVRLRSGDIDLL